MKKVADKYNAVLRELLSNVESAYKHGLKPQNDVLKVQVKLNESELSIRKAENALRLATMNLCHLIGKPLVSDIRISGNYPAVCMKESNDLLCRESVNGMFVTTFYAILNIHTGDVVYCNGGHNRPVWIRKNDKVSLLPMTGGMALGVVPGLAYKEQSLKLEAGDSLFLYTDGISEAMNLRNEQYGDIRLVEACSSVKNQSPKSMIEGISESVQSFVNGATQSDDITMLALTYKG